MSESLLPSRSRKERCLRYSCATSEPGCVAGSGLFSGMLQFCTGKGQAIIAGTAHCHAVVRAAGITYPAIAQWTAGPPRLTGAPLVNSLNVWETGCGTAGIFCQMGEAISMCLFLPIYPPPQHLSVGSIRAELGVSCCLQVSESSWQPLYLRLLTVLSMMFLSRSPPRCHC